METLSVEVSPMRYLKYHFSDRLERSFCLPDEVIGHINTTHLCCLLLIVVLIIAVFEKCLDEYFNVQISHPLPNKTIPSRMFIGEMISILDLLIQ